MLLLSVDDMFANAIIDFVFIELIIKDAEYAGNAQRAGTHYQLFINSYSWQGSQAQITY